jgi:hypothetical protein
VPWLLLIHVCCFLSADVRFDSRRLLIRGEKRRGVPHKEESPSGPWESLRQRWSPQRQRVAARMRRAARRPSRHECDNQKRFKQKSVECRQARLRSQAEIWTPDTHGAARRDMLLLHTSLRMVVHRICARRRYWSVPKFLVTPCRIANNVKGVGPSWANLRISRAPQTVKKLFRQKETY